MSWASQKTNNGYREEEVEGGIGVSPALEVNKARQLFGLKSDECLAFNLQDKEFGKKYEWNKEVRRNARQDVPLAKSVHDEEEERLQKERLEFLQNQTRIAQEDAELARRFQEDEMLTKERGQTHQELSDQELAKRLQEQEIRDQCRIRRRSEEVIEDPGRSSNYGAADGRYYPSQSSHNTGGTVIHMSSFVGFQLPTGDDLSEDERKELMKLQDEELALVLQEHERLKALRQEQRRAQDEHLNNDVRLARIMQNAQQAQIVHEGQRLQRPEQVTSRMPAAIAAQSTGQGRRHSSSSSGMQPSPAQLPQLASTQCTNHANNLQGQANGELDEDGYMSISQIQSLASTNNNKGDKSLTLVTSVGQSEFYSNVPTDPSSRERSKGPSYKMQTSDHADGKVKRKMSKGDEKLKEEGKKVNNCKQQ